MGRKPGGMRLVFVGRRAVAVALSLCLLGAWLVLWPVSSSTARGGPQSDNAPRIYHKARNFRIPFNLKPETKDRMKELHLLVSEDSGYHWYVKSKTFPNHPTFSFRSVHDGEYWFAVQTRTVDGKVSPSLDSTIEPNLKVVVDTIPPSLLLEPGERRGSLATVSWEARDENLDPRSLVVEYQVAGSTDWRRVPLGTIKLSGSRRWDAGTADALKVRASVSDRAGNVTEAFVDLPEGTGRPAGSGLGAAGIRRSPPVEYRIPVARTSWPARVSRPSRSGPPSSAGTPAGSPRQVRGPSPRASAGNRRPRSKQSDWSRDWRPPVAGQQSRADRINSDRRRRISGRWRSIRARLGAA